jgi:formate hydrogenlyase subunit 6/NADH:ubiquinone oxidoreductase subunit I
MILSKKLYRSFYTYGFFRGLIYSGKFILSNLNSRNEYFVNTRPQETNLKLNIDDFGNIKCTSCLVCEDICPASAIKIKKDIQFDSSLVSQGGVPLSFKIDLESCYHCGDCISLCPVNAISTETSFELTQNNIVELLT